MFIRKIRASRLIRTRHSGWELLTRSAVCRRISVQAPTPLHSRLVCRGEIERVEGRKVFCKATLECEEGVIAEAEGIYIHVEPDRYG